MSLPNPLKWAPKVIGDGAWSSKYLVDATVAGLAPFKPATVDIEYKYEIDFYRYIFTIEARFPDKTFCLAYKEPVDVDDILDDPESTIPKMADAFFEAFRYREIEPIPDNIELGSN